MGKAAFLIIALATAAMAAMMTGSVAHDDFGIPLDTIPNGRTQRSRTHFCGRRLRVLTDAEKVNAPLWTARLTSVATAEANPAAWRC